MSKFDGLTREELLGMVLDLRQSVDVLTERVCALEAENEELRSRLGGGGKVVPSWVKANKPARIEKERKRRKKSFTRRRETPTEVVEHALEVCPDCGRKLGGGTEHHSRQVIEIPAAAAQVIEHQVIARYCGVCGKIYVPKLDLTGQVVGTHRVGIRLMSLVAYLSSAGRMTKRTIQSFVEAMYGVHLGLGEITKILHTVAGCGNGDRWKLLCAVRGSPYINADETGWREDGKNGYIWTFSTSDTRYFVFRRSRSGQVAKEMIGESYEGVVVTDCYAGYNGLDGYRQVCWAHLTRDGHKLMEDNPNDADVACWVKAVKEVYERAKAFGSENAKARWCARVLFEEEIHGLVEPHLGRDVPQRLLAERLEKHLSELFVFVEQPEVPSDNNGAERALRPAVIARKVCGGTRSEKGSETKMTLMTLFGTWKVRGLDAMDACRKLLAGESVLFPDAA